MKAIFLAAIVLHGLYAPLAAGAETELRTVISTTMRDPVEKSYRNMVNGMELFEDKRNLAPGATLRYKLLPRQRDTKMDGITLTIAGDTVSIPVPVAADHTFTLPRDRKALDEDATVTPNRKANSMTWRTEIRTPGVPAGARRLGDLRLECEVGMEADLVSNEPSRVSNPLLRRRGYCSANPVPYLFFAERPLAGVTLSAGARRERLPQDQLHAGSSRQPLTAKELSECDCQVLIDRAYYLPLGDRSWPDDTLVEFDFRS